MPIVSAVGGLWADALDPIVRFEVDQAFTAARRTSLLSRLFNTQTSERAYEAISGVGAIGTDAWLQYEKTKRVPQVDLDQGYKTTFTHQEFIMDFEIERKTNDDGDMANLLQIVGRMGDSAAVFRETMGASVFNNAFTASAPYLGGDGVALCSDSHPLSPQKTGTVQDNNYALTLTKTNLRTIREAMMAWTDDNSNKVAVTPNLLLVPPALQDDGIEIVNSIQNPDNANNTVNPMFGRFEVLPWHYLTDSNAWFLIDTNLMMRSLYWFDRVPFSAYMRDGDDHTIASWWRAYQRFSYGWSDWKWIAGSNPS